MAEETVKSVLVLRTHKRGHHMVGFHCAPGQDVGNRGGAVDVVVVINTVVVVDVGLRLIDDGPPSRQHLLRPQTVR